MSQSPIRWILSLLVTTTLAAGIALGQDDPPKEKLDPAGPVKLRALADLPVDLEGAFVGQVEGVMILAGGWADRPWESDFSREIYYLPPAQEAEKQKDAWYLPPADRTEQQQKAWNQPDTRKWVKAGVKLPRPTAWGASAVAAQGLICMGGLTPDGPSDQVFRIVVKLNDDKTDVKSVEVVTGVKKTDEGFEGLPDLPVPLAYSRAVVIDSTLYLVGGQVRTEALDEDLAREYAGLLKAPLPQPAKPSTGPLGWLEDRVKQMHRTAAASPTWQAVRYDAPGSSPRGLLVPAVGIRQDYINEKQALWILGGRKADGRASSSIYRYIPGTTSRAGWTRWKSIPQDLVPTSAVPIGETHLLVLSRRIDGPIGEVPGKRPLPAQTPATLHLYHVHTNTWADLESLDASPEVLVDLGENQFAMVGRIGPGETSCLTQAKIQHDPRLFSWVDYAVIALYIGGMLAIGWYFSRKEKSTEDYFLGGRKVPWWAAGLSIYATGISAISFMAIPAKTFHTDWAYIAQGVFPPIATVIVAYAFVPLLRRLRITTVMEYFEMRFGKGVRTLASVQVILAQLLARMNIVILLPSQALAAVTGLDVWTCIVLMGILATVYTVLGGISAVIWTDVAQVVVVFGGALLSIGILCFNVDGGFGGILDVGMRFSKFTPVYTEMDLTIASIWVFSIWAINDMFLRLGQENLQRAFSTPDVKGARRSMITCAVISVPGTLIFYFLGSALFAYYQQNPAEIAPNLKHDQIFPLFIGQKLPVGLAGLVIAGLFAAAMSTLDSGMNVVATIITRDWFARFHRSASESARLWFARVITIVAGALATGMALYLSSFQRGSLWDTFITVSAVVGGGFAGVILVALVSRRVSQAGMIAGILAGTAMTISLEVNLFNYPFKPFVYGTFSAAVTCLVAWLVSLAAPNQKDLSGLTVWTAAASDLHAGQNGEPR